MAGEHGRRLYVALVSELDSESLALENSIGPFVAFVALDTGQLSDERLGDLARRRSAIVVRASTGVERARVRVHASDG
jgi:hypothetical protein